MASIRFINSDLFLIFFSAQENQLGKIKRSDKTDMESMKKSAWSMKEKKMKLDIVQKKLSSEKAIITDSASKQQNEIQPRSAIVARNLLCGTANNVKELQKISVGSVGSDDKLNTLREGNEISKEARDDISNKISLCDGERSDKGLITTTKNQSFDLNSKRILYVGGRLRVIGPLQTIVSGWNGFLSHHDGGKNQSINDLNQAINKADVVVFPSDCLSYSAARRVKRLCETAMKPCVVLQSMGLTSFINGLQGEFENSKPNLNHSKDLVG